MAVKSRNINEIKKELIEFIRNDKEILDLGLEAKDLSTVVDVFLAKFRETISSQIDEELLEIKGFGTFKVERKKTNP